MLLFYIFAVSMKLKVNWDALGITASVACAIHCALLPLFFSTLPLFGINIIHNTAFEAGMVLLPFVSDLILFIMDIVATIIIGYPFYYFPVGSSCWY